MGGIADYSGSLVLQLPVAAATHVALQLWGDKTLTVVSLPVCESEAPRRFEMALGEFRAGGGAVDYGAAAALFAREPDAEFLERYGGITDPVTSVDPSRWYHVRPATRHPVYEHARVAAFAGMLGEGAGRARELGELMYQSHRSYSSCCLGSPGTDELVRLAREAGPAAGLYGAKITGGGSGGTVAVLGRSDAGAAVEALAVEYARRTQREPLVISGSSPGAGVFGHLRLSRDV
jgi:hypothetical protein